MVKYMKKYHIYMFLLLFAGWLDVAGQKQVCEAAVLSEKTAAIMAASQVQEENQNGDTAEELQTGAEDFLNIKAFHLQEVEESLADLEKESSFRFADALKSLIRGEIPLNLSTLKTLVFDALLLEWKNQKETALQVFLLVIVAALVLNFTDLMEKNGTALISFFMMYLMLAAVLMKGFTGMSRMTDATLGRVNGFMKALVPSYFAAAVFAGNSVGGLAFYESAILLIAAVQWVQRYLLLPGVQLYVLFLLLDHLSKDDRLSHLAELVRTVIEWAMKSMTAAAIGFQVIDGLKNTAVSRTVSAIPGIGNLFGSVTDTVLGSAVLLKNAVGVCGMIAVLMLCLAPVCRLAFCTLIYKAMAALVQPVGDKRLNECVAAVAEGVGLLLKIMMSCSMLFFLTIAIVTASLGK